MRISLLLLTLCGVAACSTPATIPAPATSTAIPPSASAPATPPASSAGLPVVTATKPGLAVDGKHFAAEVMFEGECMPAGSRGGCYRFVFSPDGRARHLLLDAWDTGTYRIEGDAIIYRSAAPGSQDDRMESTDGFRTLSGGYRYMP